ncbi:hypothetical protein P261_00969 [Lachnospiraceae bacterium TWA4]|nr:hypothetical protein P261_00969 [Lachnospiraceae bacterium TWA4]
MPSRVGYVKQFVNIGQAANELIKDRNDASKLIDDDEFYRMDSNGNNYSLAKHQSTTSAYWSLQSSYISKYLMENSSYTDVNYNFRGLGSRTFLEELASVKYFVCKDKTNYPPYGFSYKGSTKNYLNENVYLYENKNALPLGYTYDHYLLSSDYENMTVVQRQQAMLQGVLIPDDESLKVSELLINTTPVYNNQSVEYDFKTNENIITKTNKIIVKKPKEKLVLKLKNPVKACELYLQFDKLNFKSLNSKDYNIVKILASSNKKRSFVNHYTPTSHVTHGRTNYLLNLYYDEKSRDEITITFYVPGIYEFNSLDVIAQSMKDYENQVKALKQNVLENVEITTNKIEGAISLDTSKLLCLSVPYSKGWTAYVDGQKAEIIRTNTMYMGLLLDKGKHTIELKYCTPI